MTLTDWIPSVVVAGVTALVLGLVFKYWLPARIQQSVKHEYDVKLEGFRSEMRQREEDLKSVMRKREAELTSMRDAAISGASQRNILLDKRRIDALENIWREVIALGPNKAVAQLAAVLNMKKLLEISATKTSDGQRIKEFADLIWKANKLEDRPYSYLADIERPFISASLWQLFFAYRFILQLPLMQLAVIRVGGGQSMINHEAPLLDVIKAALPDRSNYIDQYGTAGLHHLIEELESKILSHVAEQLSNSQVDAERIQKFADLTRVAEAAMNPMKPKFEVPNVIGVEGVDIPPPTI